MLRWLRKRSRNEQADYRRSSFLSASRVLFVLEKERLLLRLKKKTVAGGRDGKIEL
jgi:hypothetical protein